MKIFFHRSLLLLLLALQSVAPLVHAHLHVQAASNHSVHFHGFTVQVRQQSEIAALDLGHCDALIGIKLTIVQKKLLECEPSNASLIFRQTNSSPAIALPIAMSPSAYLTLSKAALRLSTATPRGPPL
ncbi:MAG: hypothetical protein HON51_05950 [Gammaproteobacteria bacterium]|jgi:hypothetical protein|nr:hypothetical protein [Gammaproteobacteria bacterium]MBT5223483.1 hypothetical protein [Gammaproteobacteria bacterium]MBT5825875.1 hypothetical protein [Gammaproteobacteria bacterium]MBT5966241.1 hypothetical protein [Gammaproteobacteria bacterium]MBT6421312.1 hypothetical protein [Gammaproteobacteria bacterium]